MKTINNISLSLVGLTVKTYIIAGVLWSKADAWYHAVKSDTEKTAPAPFLKTTAK